MRRICEEIASRQEKALVFTQFREMTQPLDLDSLSDRINQLEELEKIGVIEGVREEDFEKILKKYKKKSLNFHTWMINSQELDEINEELREKKSIGNRTTFYVCEGFACNEPTFELEEEN